MQESRYSLQRCCNARCINAHAGVARIILVRLLIGLGGCALICAAIPFEPGNLRCKFNQMRCTNADLMRHSSKDLLKHVWSALMHLPTQAYKLVTNLLEHLIYVHSAAHVTLSAGYQSESDQVCRIAQHNG